MAKRIVGKDIRGFVELFALSGPILYEMFGEEVCVLEGT